MNQADENGYLVSKRYSYFVFSLLFLLYMFDYLDRMVVVSLFPFLKAEWGLTDAQCALLPAAVYWSITLLTFPIAILIDRWSRKNSIGLMALIWSLATAACAFTRGFWQLFIAKCFIGVGEAGYAPGGTAMMAALFPERMRARILGIWNMSIPLGSALGIAVGGFVATHWGWRHAFGLVAIPGFIVAILFFFIKDYRTVDLVKTADQSEEGAAVKVKMKAMDIVKEFWRTPSALLTYVGFAGCTFVTTALIVWLPSYFNRVEGLTMDKASLKGGLVMLTAVLGAPIGGFVVDRWRKRQQNARLLFPAVSSLLTAGIIYLSFSLEPGAMQYVVLLCAGTAAIMFLPGAAAVTQDVVHPGLRAISYSICVIVQNLLGSSLGPIWVGSVSDRYDIVTGLKTLPLFLVVAAVLFFLGSLFYNRDVAKVEKVHLDIAG